MTQKAITPDFSRWFEFKRFDLFSWIDFEELGYQGLKEGEEEGEGEEEKEQMGQTHLFTELLELQVKLTQQARHKQ